MFSSMLYRAFKAGDKMFHVFTDHSLVNPVEYELLAVEMIKFADELKIAIKAQEDAAVKPVEVAPQAPVEAPITP